MKKKKLRSFRFKADYLLFVYFDFKCWLFKRLSVETFVLNPWQKKNKKLLKRETENEENLLIFKRLTNLFWLLRIKTVKPR